MKIIFRGLGAAAFGVLLSNSEIAEAVTLYAMQSKPDEECNCNCKSKQQSSSAPPPTPSLAQIDVESLGEPNEECNCSCKAKKDTSTSSTPSLSQVEVRVDIDVDDADLMNDDDHDLAQTETGTEFFCNALCGGQNRPSGNTTIIDASRSLYGQSNSAIGGQLKDAMSSIFGGGKCGDQKAQTGAMPCGMPAFAQTGIAGMLSRPGMMLPGMMPGPARMFAQSNAVEESGPPEGMENLVQVAAEAISKEEDNALHSTV